MSKPDLSDVPVGEIMRRWPATIGVFMTQRLLCVGCHISMFHTLLDAAEEHDLVYDELYQQIEEVVLAAEAKDSHPHAHQR